MKLISPTVFKVIIEILLTKKKNSLILYVVDSSTYNLVISNSDLIHINIETFFFNFRIV